MAAGRIIIENFMPFVDGNGAPVTGGMLTFYENGTTTLLSVYSDYDLLVPRTNPVLCDSSGRFPTIYADADVLYSVKVSDEDGVPIRTHDNVRALGPITAGGGGGGAIQGVNIRDYGEDVGTGNDDTAAFVAAKAASNIIYFPGGYHYHIDFIDVGGAPTGAYLDSGMTLYGDGPSSLISPFTITARGAIGCDSGAPDAWIEDVTIRDLGFLGSVEDNGHLETAGLLYLSGVKRLKIERLVVEGARGDGITIASGFGGGPAYERHNIDVTIKDSFLDGLIYGADGGRNPISVIDCDGMLVDNVVWTRWGRSDMPGGFDAEPDEAYSNVKNLTVRRVKASLSGGNRGHVTIATQNTLNIQNITLDDIEVYGGEGVVIYTSTASFPVAPHNITINNLKAYDCDYTINKVFGHLWGLALSNIQAFGVSATTGRSSFGEGTGTYTLRDFSILSSDIRVNSTVAIGISDTVENMRVTSSVFAGSTQAHFVLGVAGSATTNVSFIGNQFLGTPSIGTVQHDAGTPNPLTNQYYYNIAPISVSHSFRAVRTDDAGNLFNLVLTSALPSSFVKGVSRTRIENQPVVTANDSGWLFTYRESGATGEYVWQEFIPAYTAANAVTRYTRKAIDLSTWGAWSNVGAVTITTASLTPASVAANTTAEQIFAVAGILATDTVLVSGPLPTAGTGIVNSRVSSAGNVGITFSNSTGGALVPVSGTYTLVIYRR